MNLKEYFIDYNSSIAKIRKTIILKYGGAPSRQTFMNIINGGTAALETAILIVEATDEVVGYLDLLGKTKYIPKGEEVQEKPEAETEEAKGTEVEIELDENEEIESDGYLDGLIDELDL